MDAGAFAGSIGKGAFAGSIGQAFAGSIGKAFAGSIGKGAPARSSGTGWLARGLVGKTTGTCPDRADSVTGCPTRRQDQTSQQANKAPRSRNCRALPCSWRARCENPRAPRGEGRARGGLLFRGAVQPQCRRCGRHSGVGRPRSKHRARQCRTTHRSAAAPRAGKVRAFPSATKW